MKIKMTYYVLYCSEKGLGNVIITVNGGITNVGHLQAIAKHIAESNNLSDVNILNWRHLTDHDEIVKSETEDDEL